MSLHGWIIYNGNLPGDKFLDFAEFFHTAAKKRNVKTKIYSNSELLTMLSKTELTLAKSEVKNEIPDFVIFTDKDIYLARQLELIGIRVYNSAKTIEVCDDKIATYQALAVNKLPIPKTIIAPKIFPIPNVELNLNFIETVIQQLAFPIVMKEAFGSFGEQVYLVHDRTELIEMTEKLAGKPFVYQEFITTSYGKDIRIQVVGDKVIASMLRQSKDDFRANVTTGGQAEKYEPTHREKEIAILASKAIGADFSGVDLLFGENGEPIICEVNSNAHIRVLYESTGINVADEIIDYILSNHQ